MKGKNYIVKVGQITWHRENFISNENVINETRKAIELFHPINYSEDGAEAYRERFRNASISIKFDGQKDYTEIIQAKLKVFVVGFESNGVSFWNWFNIKQEADKQENELLLDEDLKNNGIIYKGSVLVNDTDNKDAITKEVETFLEINDWENSFSK